jgi:glyoxylase-like metal-dependent hydrolase (beta-lactamase superfamily II)
VPFEEISVGDVRVRAILDLQSSEGPIVDSFPGAPAEALLAERARYPGVYGSDDEWILRVRAWLVVHPSGILLMDTGVGGPASPSMGWAPEPGSLMSGLAEAEIAAADVDTVVLSHVHDDHIGGTTDEAGAPAFPAARYVIQRADLEWQREGARETDEDATLWERLLAPLEERAQLDTVEGDVALDDRFGLRHAPGHTPGHQLLVVTDGDQRLIVSADAFNHPAQLDHPDWPSGPDADHDLAAHSRRALLEDLRERPDTILAPTHFDRAFGRFDPDAASPWVVVGSDENPATQRT